MDVVLPTGRDEAEQRGENDRPRGRHFIFAGAREMARRLAAPIDGDWRWLQRRSAGERVAIGRRPAGGGRSVGGGWRTGAPFQSERPLPCDVTNLSANRREKKLIRCGSLSTPSFFTPISTHSRPVSDASTQVETSAAANSQHNTTRIWHQLSNVDNFAVFIGLRKKEHGLIQRQINREERKMDELENDCETDSLRTTDATR